MATSEIVEIKFNSYFSCYFDDVYITVRILEVRTLMEGKYIKKRWGVGGWRDMRKFKLEGGDIHVFNGGYKNRITMRKYEAICCGILNTKLGRLVFKIR